MTDYSRLATTDQILDCLGYLVGLPSKAFTCEKTFIKAQEGYMIALNGVSFDALEEVVEKWLQGFYHPNGKEVWYPSPADLRQRADAITYLNRRRDALEREAVKIRKPVGKLSYPPPAGEFEGKTRAEVVAILYDRHGLSQEAKQRSAKEHFEAEYGVDLDSLQDAKPKSTFKAIGEVKPDRSE